MKVWTWFSVFWVWFVGSRSGFRPTRGETARRMRRKAYIFFAKRSQGDSFLVLDNGRSTTRTRTMLRRNRFWLPLEKAAQSFTRGCPSPLALDIREPEVAAAETET